MQSAPNALSLIYVSLDKHVRYQTKRNLLLVAFDPFVNDKSRKSPGGSVMINNLKEPLLTSMNERHARLDGKQVLFLLSEKL